jgi:hypothetical protein
VEDSPNTSNGRLPQESPPTREDRVEGELTIVNEFTAVRVRKVATRNGERLEISSLRFDGSIRLDALALEGLSWQDPEVIGSFLEQPYGPEPKE